MCIILYEGEQGNGYSASITYGFHLEGNMFYFFCQPKQTNITCIAFLHFCVPSRRKLCGTFLKGHPHYEALPELDLLEVGVAFLLCSLFFEGARGSRRSLGRGGGSEKDRPDLEVTPFFRHPEKHQISNHWSKKNDVHVSSASFFFFLRLGDIFFHIKDRLAEELRPPRRVRWHSGTFCSVPWLFKVFKFLKKKKTTKSGFFF